MMRAAYVKLWRPAGRHTTNYQPSRAAYGKLCCPAGQHTINYATLHGSIIFKPWASSVKYENQKGVVLLVLPFHVIMLIRHPCPRERENIPPTSHIMPPMGLIICPVPTGHIMLPSSCIMLPSGPPALWQHSVSLGQIMGPRALGLIPLSGVAYCTVVGGCVGRCTYLMNMMLPGSKKCNFFGIQLLIYSVYVARDVLYSIKVHT